MNSNNYLRFAFLTSTLGMAGSLFFSEVMLLPPCVLCWYQRICLYPLVVIFGVGILRTGKECIHYAMPLIGLGLGLAFYHNLLYYNLIEGSLVPCSQGVSCTSKQIEWLGFITIPMLSLMAFSMLMVLAFLAYFGNFKNFLLQLKEGRL